MPIRYLHIGGPKTGSTFLQSVFRTNRSALPDLGIHYPPGNEAPDIIPTSWTSGNGENILESHETFAKALEQIRHHRGSSLLYSHEGLRNEICKSEKVSFMAEIAREYGFSRIKVLFFVRDPVAYATSIWQHNVKNDGIHDSLDDRIKDPVFMLHNYRTTQHILELLSGNDIFELTAQNYSRCADRLYEVTCDWLGISETALIIPQVTRINRSLTRAELTLQMAMNRILGGDAKIVARNLTEILTEVRSDTIVPSSQTQQILWERIEPMVLRANQYLPPGHEIIFDRQEAVPDKSDQFTFSSAQLEIIGRVVAEEIRNLRYPYIPTPVKKSGFGNRLKEKVRDMINKACSSSNSSGK